MKMKQLYLLILALTLTCFVNLNEGKRTSSGRRTSSGSSSYGNTRRVATSAPKYTSKPNYGSSYSSGSNTQVKPNYGFTQPKPQGPPPSYTATNNAGSRTNIYEKPPSYQQPSYAAKPSNTQQSSISRTATQKPVLSSNNQRPIASQTQRPLQSSYPKQQYPVNSGIPANARPVNQLPPNAHMVNPPSYNSGHQPSGGYRPQYITNNYHAPPPNVPVQQYAAGAVQPGYYPPGSFPKQSSGPGFGTGLGTGLIAGAIGGAVLHSAISPGNRNHYDSYGGGGGGGGTQREITREVYNSTNTIYVNGAPPAESGVPVAGNSGTPLAPINTGMPQEQQQSGAMNPSLIHTPVQPNQSDGNVQLAPLAPLAPNENGNNNNNDNSTQAPAYYCYNEINPQTNVSEVFCYQVPANSTSQFEQSDIASNQQLNAGPSSQSITNTESYSITQKTSSATMSESAKIKQSGAIGKEISIITPILTILLALFLQ